MDSDPSFKEQYDKKNNIVLLLLIVLMIVSCVFIYYGTTYLFSINRSSKVLFTDNNLPRIDASIATQPLVDAFILNFTGKTSAELNIKYTNTHSGYVKLIEHETDLIVVTEPTEEEINLAKNKGIDFDITKVVNEGFVFFVNRNNKVDNVTFEQIQKIYAGDITNWKELGGDNKEIVAYQKSVNSENQRAFLSLVMKGMEVKSPIPSETINFSTGIGEIIDYIANYDNSIDSLGYSYYFYANKLYKNDDLKYLKINGVMPNYQTIRNYSYPILTTYYIVTRKNEENENVLKLKEAMLSKRGKLVASEVGYVPVQ